METLVEVGLGNAALAAFMALAVFGVSLAVRRPALLHALWVIVLLKLVTPPIALAPIPRPGVRVRDTAAYEVQAHHATESIATAGPLAENGIDARDPLPAVHEAPALAATPVTPPAPAAPLLALSLEQALAACWLAGSAFVLALAVFKTWRFTRLVRPGEPRAVEASREALEVARKMGCARAPQVVFVPGAVSPLLFSLPGRAARIVFPSDLWSRLDPGARSTILAHEIAHWRRRDHWVRWLELAATALYWWHPAVWLARRELRRTEDACCDAWVVATYPESARAYGSALLETVDFLAGARAPALLPGSGIGAAAGLKRRLTRIFTGTGPRALSRGGWAIVLLAAAAALPFAPGWAQDKEPGPVRAKGSDDEKNALRLEPEPEAKGVQSDIAKGEIPVRELLKFLARYHGLPVITGSTLVDRQELLEGKVVIVTAIKDADGAVVESILEANGLSVERSTLPNGKKVLTVKSSQNVLSDRIKDLEGKLDRALKEIEHLHRKDPKEGTATPAGAMKRDVAYRGKLISQWLKDLADRDEKTSTEAEQALAALGWEAIPHLLEATESDDPVLRANAAGALTRPRESRKTAEGGRIASPRGQVKDLAMARVAALIRLLRDPEEEVRKTATRLGTSGDTPADAVPLLIAALDDPAPFVRSTAARALGITALKFLWKAEADSPERLVVLEAVPALRKALGDDDVSVSRSAAMALRDFGADAASAAPALAKLIGHPDPDTALEAAWTLADVAPSESTEALVARLVSGLRLEDEVRRGRSALALGRVGPAARPALPALVEILPSDSSEYARGWIAVALAAIDPQLEAAPAPNVVGALVDAVVYRGHPELREAAAEALASLGPAAKDAVPALEDLLGEQPGTAGRIKSSLRPGKKSIRAALSPGDPVREKAAEALRKIRGE